MSWFDRLWTRFSASEADTTPTPKPVAPKKHLGTLAFKPVSGDLVGFLFENDHPHVQMPLNLFWGLQLNLELTSVPALWADMLGDEDWPFSFGTDWITWPVANWKAVEGMGLDDLIDPESLETSIYLLSEHWPATASRLSMSRGENSAFKASVAAHADIDMGSATGRLEVEGDCEIDFEGIIVTPDNHFPKPNTIPLATNMLSNFISTADLVPETNERRQFVFKPSGDA